MTKQLVAAGFLGAAVVAVGTVAHAAGGEPEAGPYCIHFTNFCDQIQVNTNPTSGNFFGFWDWSCDCEFDFTPGIGRMMAREGGAATPTFTATPVTFIQAVEFVFHPGTHTFDQWWTDGRSDVLGASNQPWTATPGPCGCVSGGRSSFVASR
jgi:hypothetical protein